MYKVGDRVVVKENHYLSPYNGPSVATVGSIAYVTEVLSHGCQLALDPDCDPDEHSDRSLFFWPDCFEPYAPPPDFPTFQTMDTAPAATKENPVILYYQEAGVIPFAERDGDGWGYRAIQWRKGRFEVLNYILETPLGWMPMQYTSHNLESI